MSGVFGDETVAGISAFGPVEGAAQPDPLRADYFYGERQLRRGDLRGERRFQDTPGDFFRDQH
jgi:hypothetical protein